MNHAIKRALPYILVGLWFVFTISLAGWWYIFSIAQTQRVIEASYSATPELTRHLYMLRLEGVTLMLCIFFGAAGMLYYIFREMRQNKKLQTFFSTFTHELKTPLASIRLQAESLSEDLKNSDQSRLAERLVVDTERLTLQLENSLFLAQEDSLRLFLEATNLPEFISGMQSQFPDLLITVSGNERALVDRRALECVIRNLLLNAQVHGKATEVSIALSSQDDRVSMTIQDNGGGFQGDRAKIGKAFTRLYTGSGNGIGLHIVQRLLASMGGKVSFPASRSDRGFLVQLDLEKAST